MKWATFLFVCTLGLVLTSCKDEKFDPENPDVDHFVSLIRNGNYTEKVGYDLPHFNMEDVEKLMTYLDDTTEIKYFPANPITSKRTEPKILNECIMWTIDGIRLGERYPSLEPCLMDITSFSEYTGYARLTKKELLSMADNYIRWYQEYLLNPTDAVRKRDIIDKTKYRWN
jgi:hypothetical protein